MANADTKTKILCVEADYKELTSQAALLQKAGYNVQSALGRNAAEGALRGTGFDVVVLGHTLSRGDRHHLPYIAKKFKEDCKVLVLHASGKHHAVDLAIDSRRGDSAILEAVNGLLALEPSLAG
jgi:DNA-binding NtrC family response regulator